MSEEMSPVQELAEVSYASGEASGRNEALLAASTKVLLSVPEITKLISDPLSTLKVRAALTQLSSDIANLK